MTVPEPYPAPMLPAGHRDDPTVEVGERLADLPQVTEVRLATLIHMGRAGGLVDCRELSRDTLAALLRAGLVSGGRRRSGVRAAADRRRRPDQPGPRPVPEPPCRP